MSTIKTFIKQHLVLTCFARTFVIPWGGILLVIGGPGGIPPAPDQFDLLLPVGDMALMAGPSVAGTVLTGLVYGRAGSRESLSRLLRWGVGVRWYAVAHLTAPLLMTAVWRLDRRSNALLTSLLIPSN
jgi:uncharacterized protein